MIAILHSARPFQLARRALGSSSGPTTVGCLSAGWVCGAHGDTAAAAAATAAAVLDQILRLVWFLYGACLCQPTNWHYSGYMHYWVKYRYDLYYISATLHHAI